MTKTGSLPCTVGDGYDGTAGTYGAETDVSGKKVSPDRRKTGVIDGRKSSAPRQRP